MIIVKTADREPSLINGRVVMACYVRFATNVFVQSYELLPLFPGHLTLFGPTRYRGPDGPLNHWTACYATEEELLEAVLMIQTKYRDAYNG